jgi:hypothetical protein
VWAFPCDKLTFTITTFAMSNCDFHSLLLQHNAGSLKEYLVSKYGSRRSNEEHVNFCRSFLIGYSSSLFTSDSNNVQSLLVLRTFFQHISSTPLVGAKIQLFEVVGLFRWLSTHANDSSVKPAVRALALANLCNALNCHIFEKQTSTTQCADDGIALVFDSVLFNLELGARNLSRLQTQGDESLMQEAFLGLTIVVHQLQEILNCARVDFTTVHAMAEKGPAGTLIF